MERIDRILSGLDKCMALVEVGPSHSPIVPKSAGWNTVVVDYTDAASLREHYKNESYERIEQVDIIWRSGQMHEAFHPRKLASYDAVISSHSLEHMPDAIGFLQSCEKLVKADGIVRLALPDKRCCFDFFSGLSTSGDMLCLLISPVDLKCLVLRVRRLDVTLMLGIQSGDDRTS